MLNTKLCRPFGLARSEIDGLMAKYLGQEHTMYLKICSLSQETYSGYYLLRMFINPNPKPWFHHLSLPQVSCSEAKAVQAASGFFRVGLGGAGGGR